MNDDDQEEFLYCRELLSHGPLTAESLMRERSSSFLAGRRSVQMEEAERMCAIAEAKLELPLASSISGVRQSVEHLLARYTVTDQDRTDVWALLRWRDMQTDLYGEDLLALLMHEFVQQPPNRQYPDEYSGALKALRQMTETDRIKLIDHYYTAGHEDH